MISAELGTSPHETASPASTMKCLVYNQHYRQL